MSSRNNAEFLATLLNQRELTGAGVEIGVYRGDFSVLCLQYWPGTLHLVDPWNLPLKGGLHGTPADLEITRTALERADVYDRAVLHITQSHVAATLFPAASLQFIYVDGAHNYAQVKRDFACWWDKLAPGGLFAGHDYRHNCGVPRALWELMHERNFTYSVRPDERDNGLWWGWKT